MRRRRRAFAIVGVAVEIGIEATARHAIDLRVASVFLAEIFGAGHSKAPSAHFDSIQFMDAAMIADLWSFTTILSTAS